MKKIQISIDEELLTRIDNYSRKNYMSRSGFISLACNNHLNSVEAVSLISNMNAAMKRVAETGTCDPETLKQLEDFDSYVKMIIGKSEL